MIDAVNLISNLGFPIFVAVYFMVKTEKVIKNNTIVMAEVRDAMRKCTK